MIALIDCNNFYASCERIFNPRLECKPVVVLSNNDGCVISRSEEAKRIGIPMGAPAFQYKEMFRRNHVEVLSANFPLYGDMSRRVMRILSGYSPQQEIYSIDECFLDLTGMQVDFREYAEQMRSQVMLWTGIPISVGIAPTKVLAKAANHIAKRFPNQLNDVHVIDGEELLQKALKWLDVDRVWGIGRRNANKLKKAGIRKAAQFTELSESWVLQHMTITGLRLQKELKGIRALTFEQNEKSKSISTTRTFEFDYNTFEQLKERIVTFTTLSADKLRRQNSLCTHLALFIQTNIHKESEAQYSNQIEVKLPFPTSSTLELVEFAVMGLKNIFRPHYHYKRAGVTLYQFVDADQYQMSLFYNSNPKHKPLMKAVDHLNRKHGSHLVRIASMDKQIFKMKQEYLSPAYTTNISDVIKVKIG